MNIHLEATYIRSCNGGKYCNWLNKKALFSLFAYFQPQPLLALLFIICLWPRAFAGERVQHFIL